MEAYQKRVAEERQALCDKLNKLESFIAGDAFAKLPAEDRDLLQEQRDCMRTYRDVLVRRIARFRMNP